MQTQIEYRVAKLRVLAPEERKVRGRNMDGRENAAEVHDYALVEHEANHGCDNEAQSKHTEWLWGLT